jgi:hypothetical protein
MSCSGKYVIFVLLVLLCFSGELPAAFERGGGLGNGARPLGMGGANVAVADELSAIYWNPAGLYQQRRIEVYGMYGNLYNNKRQNLFMTVALPHPADFCFAVSADNKLPDGESDFLEGSYIFTFALPLVGDQLAAGLNLKYLRGTEKASETSAAGIGTDFGLLYKIRPEKRRFFHGVNVGLAIADLSTNLRYSNGREEQVKRHLTSGVAYFFDRKTLFALDFAFTDAVDLQSGDKQHMRGGLESWFLQERVGVRGGYTSFFSKEGQISAGFSYRATDWQLDYAFLGGGDIGNSHRIAYAYSFREVEVERPAPIKVTAELIERIEAQTETPPQDLVAYSSDKRIHLEWEGKEGVKGYNLFMKKSVNKKYRILNTNKVIKDNFWTIPGAPNNINFDIYVVALVDSQGKSTKPSKTVTAAAKAIDPRAKSLYIKALRFYQQDKLNQALVEATKAQQIDSKNYEINTLLKRIRSDKMILNL